VDHTLRNVDGADVSDEGVAAEAAAAAACAPGRCSDGGLRGRSCDGESAEGADDDGDRGGTGGDVGANDAIAGPGEDERAAVVVPFELAAE
jgi:hypothetical protein